MKIIEIPVSKIDRDKDQPRKHFDKEQIRHLANSIKEHGLLQPVTVRAVGKRYVIVVGERRWRAHRMAKLRNIRCIVSKIHQGNDLRNCQAAENTARESMLPSEEGKHIDRQIKLGQSYDQLAKSLGKCKANIIAIHQLLQLPKVMLDEVDTGTLSIVTAKHIAKLPPAMHHEAYRRTCRKGVLEARAILHSMELNNAQLKVLGLTNDEALAARRDRTLSEFEQFKIASHAFLSGKIADIGMWISRSSNIDTLLKISSKILSIVDHVQANGSKHDKMRDRVEGVKVTDISLMSPQQKAWVKIRMRKNV